MGKLRRACRIGGWGMLVAAVAAAGVWIASGYTRAHFRVAGAVVGFDGGAIEVGRSSAAIERRANGWAFKRGGSMRLDRQRRWVPSEGWIRYWSATGGGTPVVIRVTYVPLATVVAGLGAGGALLWLLGRPRRGKPGHCRACGYDLSGLAGGKCPECGEGLARRVWRRVRGWMERGSRRGAVLEGA